MLIGTTGTLNLMSDYIIIRFIPETIQKLYARSAGLFKILPNAYIIDLPSDFGNNLTFNISDLVAYKDPFNPDNSLVDLDEPNLSLSLRATLANNTYYTCLICSKTN